ncbi:diguanylate cyclase [Deinococcus sp.]|uniref:diguanylate cyclase n=1 Tax=Deinococcus sp. TaxID=47478 RepID=UPI003C7E8B22
MLDWLAVGWNLAMTLSGAFLVSLSFRGWPLNFGRNNAVLHTALTVVTALVIGLYPHGLLTLAPGTSWGSQFATLVYVPLVTLMLSYRPGWALLAGLLIVSPELLGGPLLRGLWTPGQPTGLGAATATAGVLLVAALQRRRLGVLNFSDREAAFRLPLIFLPLGLPLILSLGLTRGLVPALLLIGTNLIGFLIGMQVLRSRFRLLATSARLSRQALTDPLTGLWNRRRLEHDLSGLAPGGHVLIIDLDYFKTINDRFGHDVGDGYLVGVAAALSRALHAFQDEQQEVPGTRRRRGQTRTAPSGQAYRMGGEEFAVLTAETGAERVALLARGIMDQIREVRHRANPGGQLTSSVGMAQHGLEISPPIKPQTTLRRADMALMQAKANGRNRMETAGPPGDVPATGLIRSSSRPAQPLLWEAIHASLSLAALDRDLTPDDWTRLLQAAILSVPGAEAGSINVRQDNEFVLCAQIGFDDHLLDLRHSEREQLDWYGLGQDAWRRGQPRVLYGEDIALHSDTEPHELSELHHAEHFRIFGKVAELQASLCIPVLMDGEVVGHLNLDRSSDRRPFDEEDLRVARAFADQVTVLTVAARRRSGQERQHREHRWLLEFSLDLLTLTDAPGIAQALLQRLHTLYGLNGQLVPGAPPVEGQPSGAYALPLDWTGGLAHLRLEGTAGFAAHDWQLLAQAARAANAALASLKMRAATG